MPAAEQKPSDEPDYARLHARALVKIHDLREALKEAIDYMPDGFTDCAGYKCRQPNCQACFGDSAEDGTVRKEKLGAMLG